MQFNRILVPVDGSSHAAKALELAVQLQSRFDTENDVLWVLSVYQHFSVMESSHSLVQTREGLMPPDEALKQVSRGIVNWHVEKAKELGGVGVKGVIKRGKPSRTIIDFAREQQADCVVMGGRGMGDAGGVLLGSVSHKVASLVACTCITVK